MRRIPSRWVPLVSGALLAVLGLVGITALWGGFPVRWSPDSVHYFAAAESISSGSGFTGIDGGPMVVWPPGYPLVLSLGALALGGTNAAARTVNVLAYIAVVIVSVAILHRVVRKPVIRWAGAVAVVVSPALSLVLMHVWSDLLFTALVMSAIGLVLLGLDRADRRWLVVGGVVAGLAVSVRYLGVSIGAAGTLTILLASAGGWRRRLGDTLLFGLGAFGVPGLLFIWNVARTGTLTGERLAACTGVRTVVDGAFDVVGVWFGFDRGPWSGVGVIVAVLGASILAWIMVTDRTTRATLLAFAVFVVVYLVTLVAGSIRANVDPPDFRLLLPAYAPFVILATVSLGVFADRMREHARVGKWATAVGIAGAILVFVVGPVLASIDTTEAWSPGIRNDIRHEAGTSTILAENLSGDERVISNRPHIVYLEWGGPVERTPFLHSCASDRPHSHVLDESALRQLVVEYGSVTLVWFDTGDGPLPLFDGFVSQRLIETDDGVVLRLTGVVGSES